ncbi:MAG: phenylacetate--CoA ligase family protein [Flavobacteriaceae bacterium]|nr:phenylacetate--CoA ligase family protein [Flavobacteriaceae bacterium]
MKRWDADKIEAWQHENLQKLINDAYQNTVYYKELFDELGIKPGDIKTKEDLEKIPVLTRQIIIDNFDKLVSRKVKSIPHTRATTGGTTGTPMTYLLDNSSWSFTNADYIVNWERTAYNFGDKHLALGGSSLFGFSPTSLKHKIYYALKGRIKLDGMQLSDNVLKSYAELLKKKKIKYIYGYASSMYLLAKYILDNNIFVTVNACFPTSEILTDHYRETIIQAFKCKIVNSYGANDGGITAFEHRKGCFEVGYNVLMRVDGKQSKGPLLLTNLLNYAMPMINYQVGDAIKIKEQVMDYNGQIIEELYGRTSSILKLNNGNILTGFGMQSALFQLPVQAWNLEQIDGNNLLCKVIRKAGFKASDEAILISKLKEYAGDGIGIEVKYFDRFELTSSGKRNYFMNE